MYDPVDDAMSFKFRIFFFLISSCFKMEVIYYSEESVFLCSKTLFFCLEHFRSRFGTNWLVLLCFHQPISIVVSSCDSNVISHMTFR